MEVLPTKRTADHGCACFGVGAKRLDSKPVDNLHSDDDATLLAKELNELSVQEREKVLEDIHGVAETKVETPEFITCVLEELDSCIAELPYVKRKDLDRAFFLKPNLHADNKFKLMFLRADHYNAYQAAERMAKYFTNKLTLFGEEKLVKKITLDDLDEQDKMVLFSDGNIVLPHKDRAGRPIWYSDCSKADFVHTTSTIRAFWYLAMATLEDEDAQIKGISCILFYPGGEFPSNLPSISQVTNILMQVGSVHQCLPCRISSFHFGTDEPNLRFFLTTLQKGFGKQVRLRLRSHFGSAMEMRYSLLSYGIPCAGLLVSENEGGDEKPKIIRMYQDQRIALEKREKEQRESEEKRTGVIVYPAPGDVLLGRGRPYQDFIGNRHFAEMIDTQIYRFQQCSSQFEKTCVIMDVVKTVQDSGGRFLKRNSNGWEVISDGVARKKTGTTFRTRAILAAQNPSVVKVKSSSPVMSQQAKRMKFDHTTELY